MRNYLGQAAMLATTIMLAVGCYSLSLRVSGERAAVDKLRRQMVADSRDIRTLQAELRTRARMPELQRWNDETASLRMKAPVAAQYLRDPVQLASFARPPAAAVAAEAPVLRYAVTGDAPKAVPVAPAAALVRTAYAVPAAARPAADLDALIGDAIAESAPAGHDAGAPAGHP